MASAQKLDTPSTGGNPQVIFLDLSKNGQHIGAMLGQQVEISLGAMIPCDPQISSPALQLESVALDWPPPPGIATHIYIFAAAAQGEARVRIPITDCSSPDLPGGLTFAVTVRVGPSAGKSSTLYAFRTADQANRAPWDGGWTILEGNSLRQSFIPALPKLTGVEVELEPANPGDASGEVTMTLLDAEGRVLSVVAKTVPAADCGHVRFALPRGGWPVSPGQVYSIELSGGGGLFGWKYVVGGYKSDVASFDRKPLLHGPRRSFLFQTFGAS